MKSTQVESILMVQHMATGKHNGSLFSFGLDVVIKALCCTWGCLLIGHDSEFFGRYNSQFTTTRFTKSTSTSSNHLFLCVCVSPLVKQALELFMNIKPSFVSVSQSLFFSYVFDMAQTFSGHNKYRSPLLIFVLFAIPQRVTETEHYLNTVILYYLA